MARLILLLLPLVCAFGAGYGIGINGKRRAISKTYREFIPVLASCRQLLFVDPSMPNQWLLAKRDLETKLDIFESEVRAL